MSPEPRHELESLTRALAGELERQRRHGARHLDAAGWAPVPTPPPAPSKPPAEAKPKPPAPQAAPAPPPAAPRVAPAPQPAPAVPRPVHRRKAPLAGPRDLASFRRSLQQCMDCSLSAGARGSGALLGRGSARPSLVLITDFGGPAERAYGKVLAPEAGQIIAKLVTAGYKLRLEDVYVTAAVKCPLGQGCRPSPKQAKACSRHLQAELELLRPAAIVAFGTLASASLGLSDPGGLEALRGRLHQYMVGSTQTPLVVTAHPRDLLADPSLKPRAWADLKLLLPTLADDGPG